MTQYFREYEADGTEGPLVEADTTSFAALIERANKVHLLTSNPNDADGDDNDVAIVRSSSILINAYKKVAGAWIRQWAFSGGDAIFLAFLPAIADREPATDPDSTTFNRHIGVSGYSPVTQEDIDSASSSGNINNLADWRSGNYRTQVRAKANTLPDQDLGNDLEDFSVLTFGADIGIYVWFGINAENSIELNISSVSYNEMDIPVTKQAEQIGIDGDPIDIWVSDNQYNWSEIKDYPFILTVEKNAGAPNTYNRYSCVTQNAIPTEADFLATGARVSSNSIVRTPAIGWWENNQGYLHFALPSDQDAPTLVGRPASLNLVDNFTIRPAAQAITINGDSMRTLSSKMPVYTIDSFSLSPWLVR